MPINIFICYKKLLQTERDGKIIERDSKADILHSLLKQEPQFLPWMDQPELSAGMEWEATIYSRILESDVLLALIEAGTSKSQWVQREIALANALGIAVFPLGTDLKQEEIVAELRVLGIQQLQGKGTYNLKSHTGDALLAEIRGDLVKAAERTKKQQEQTLKPLLTRRGVQSPKAPDKKSAAKFQFVVDGKTALHVASGDVAKVRGVDAFVNSENDYMQMARFFESKTVSATLRRMGSRIRDGRYHDTIQHELDLQLLEKGRPVQCGDVFVTSSGGPHSVLAKDNKARYILHVAAVQAVAAEARVVPFKQPFQIEACGRSVLDKIMAVNEAKGVISPRGWEQRIEQEQRATAGDAEIRSVIFPLFGTGQGGSAVNEVLGPMLDGMAGFLSDRDGQMSVRDIFLSAYTTQDVDEVITFLQSRPELVRV